MIDSVGLSPAFRPQSEKVGGGSAKEDPEKIKKAAEQFEALMIGQMLKAAHEAGSGGWMGTGDDQAGQTGMDMAEQQFASLIASRGGLGLARFITNDLERKGR